MSVVSKTMPVIVLQDSVRVNTSSVLYVNPPLAPEMWISAISSGTSPASGPAKRKGEKTVELLWHIRYIPVLETWNSPIVDMHHGSS